MGCRNHPSVETALQLCWICQHTFCGDCVVEFQGRTMCAPCKAEAVARLEAGAPQVGGETEPTPWERRAELGLGRAVFLTWKAVSLEPVRTFSRLDTRSQSKDVLVLVMIVAALSGVGQAISETAWPLLLGMELDVTPFDKIAESVGMKILFAGLVVVLSVLGALVGAYIGSGLQHLYLVVTRQARLPHLQTLRGYCYAQTPTLLGIIAVPVFPVGAWVGALWTLVANVIMIREVHRTTTMHAVLAALWILVVCLGFVCLAGGGFMFAALAR